MYKKISRIHLVGVGGIGMSGIAHLLINDGFDVSGSDVGDGEILRTLREKGVKVFRGHDASHVDGADLVVHSSAISPGNPELVSAKDQGILVIQRADMLAELMRLKYGIAVAGAHGKTTTTSLLGNVLMDAGLDPTIVVGGRMDNFGGSNARPGEGDFMVVEADESDGTFNRLTPSIAVATNMDREHMDFYGSMDALKDAFVAFLNRVPFYGVSVICGDDPYLTQLITKVKRRTILYGFDEKNAYQITSYTPHPTGSTFSVRTPTDTVELSLQVPGRHNALNAVAALVVADEIGVARDRTQAGLKSFQGVQRRFQFRGEKQGVRFIDDYAHHPVEINATVEAVKERFPDANFRVIFQPHRYSRVADLLDQFNSCFSGSTTTVITNIYAAGEDPIPGVESAVLVENLSRAGQRDVRLVPTPAAAVQQLIDESRPGDVILTMGAGDLPNVYQDIL